MVIDVLLAIFGKSSVGYQINGTCQVKHYLNVARISDKVSQHNWIFKFMSDTKLKNCARPQLSLSWNQFDQHECLTPNKTSKTWHSPRYFPETVRVSSQSHLYADALNIVTPPVVRRQTICQDALHWQFKTNCLPPGTSFSDRLHAIRNSHWPETPHCVLETRPWWRCL